MSRHVPRIYVQQDLLPGDEVILTPAQSHHLLKVMRMKVGYALQLFNGREGEWLGELLKVEKQQLHVAVQELLRPQIVEAHRCLLFALIKPARMSILVEQATELGVTHFVPLTTEYTNAGKVNMQRYHEISVAASQQCRRLSVPLWQEIQPLNQVLQHWDKDTKLLYCDERGDINNFLTTLQGLGRDNYAMLVGPEGGFSAQEFSLLAQQPFAQGVSLGPNILRTGTAALVALSVAMMVD